ncbi:flagellar basal body rod C-terminal domain-containing protein [Xanthomonas oryzae]|uniref:flagellar basal body rod C-terminal domain-containing protein n=1 Tax=Xanthomonas oryzae TaxID=347 RepID=UPI0010330B4E|nr:flagellar basal body rod C-terminal domain-containing protein [Xanthomonas oryzae]QBG97564.1 flagellar hook basal-body protein [Xanthomonas oryzae]QBG98357.1 flagellar hook basal-body protein [Xanthomonas oryzae]
MSDTIQAISRSLNSDIEALTAVSQNVANLNTPGYQSVRARGDFAAASGATAMAVQRGDGALRQTGRGLDLALRGNGFFVTQQDGQQRLLRMGSFVRGADGTMQTREGAVVLTDAGRLTLPQSDIRVDAQGGIWDGDALLARLSIVDVAEPARLIPAEGGYRYDGVTTQWQGTVQQGSVEQSNVDAAAETMQLIELSRHAESVQRVISLYDRAMDTGINRIGDN